MTSDFSLIAFIIISLSIIFFDSYFLQFYHLHNENKQNAQYIGNIMHFNI